MLAKLISTAIILFVSFISLKAQEYFQIQNRWKADEFINVEQPKPASGSIQPGWLSAQWIFEPVSGTSYFLIKNEWRNEYLHIKNGAIECSAIQPGWWSAHWALEPVAGSSFFRIRNRWKPEVALHNQQGFLEAAPVELGWWSAQWQTIRVGDASATGQQPTTAPASSLSNRNSENPSAFAPEHNGRIEQAAVRYTDQISISGTISVGSQIYFFPQEVIVNTEGLSFDAKNPPIGGQTFTVIETTPRLKLDRPMPMMRNQNNDSIGLVVEVY